MAMQFPKVNVEYIHMDGGVNQITPLLQQKSGACKSALNFECSASGGYTRIAGYERFDGHPSPSAAGITVLTVTGSTLPALGVTITGATSGATGVLVASSATAFVLTKVTGTFNGTEVLTNGGTVGTQTGFGYPGITPKLFAQFKAAAADNYRADISKPAGSGAILGAFMYKDIKYCFRNNVGGSAAVMFKSTASGWSAISLGRELPFGPLTSTVTMTIAAPGVVSWANHALPNGTAVMLTTTGALPTGLSVNTNYYVVSAAAGTFQLALTVGGASITTSGSQSGVHTAVAMSVAIADGATVTGKISGATATVARAVLSGGAWAATNPFGRLVFATVTGAFQSGEQITVGGVATVQTTAVDTAITLLPSGKFDFDETNFAGSAKTTRVYGCDGVNRGFEWDGTTFVPIATGTTTDTPTLVTAHKNQCFWAFGSSVIHSAPRLPYDYTALSGASEIATGDIVTGMLVQPGAQTTASMLITNPTNTLMLYGTGVATWNLVAFNTGTGALPWTAQNMAASHWLDNRGVVELQTTLNYGNFQQNTLTTNIQPLIINLRTKTVSSVLCREKSQYRLFFTNGMALFLTIVNGRYMGAMPIYLPITGGVNNAWEGTASNGDEVILLCGADGYVYQAEKGTSFDGAAIGASIILHFDSIKSPRVLKSFKKAVVEMKGTSYAELALGYQVAYASSQYFQPTPQTYNQTMLQANWDTAIWDTFFWDSQDIVPLECDLGGDAENISLTFTTSDNYFDSFTLNSVLMHYIQRRSLR